VRWTGDWSDRVRYRKRCLFFFVGQKYLGYSFLSGAPEDQVRFDENLVSKIIKGKTTKDEVLALFGRPDAWLHFPVVPDKGAFQDYVGEEGDSLVDYAFHLFPGHQMVYC
jgi:hypothetical protein